jgi:hypothetical protein
VENHTKPTLSNDHSVSVPAEIIGMFICQLLRRNFSCANRIEGRVDFQYSGTPSPCPLRLLKRRLKSNAKIPGAAGVRPFIVDRLAVAVAMKTGEKVNLAVVRVSC